MNTHIRTMLETAATASWHPRSPHPRPRSQPLHPCLHLRRHRHQQRQHPQGWSWREERHLRTACCWWRHRGQRCSRRPAWNGTSCECSFSEAPANTWLRRTRKLWLCHTRVRIGYDAATRTDKAPQVRTERELHDHSGGGLRWCGICALLAISRGSSFHAATRSFNPSSASSPSPSSSPSTSAHIDVGSRGGRRWLRTKG